MALLKHNQSNTLILPIENVARLIRSFSRQQQALLMQLVPELRVVGTELPAYSTMQSDLVNYFQQKMAELPNSRPMNENDPFIDEFTVGEFFSLPETEQERIWTNAERFVQQQFKNIERDIHPNAIPAR